MATHDQLFKELFERFLPRGPGAFGGPGPGPTPPLDCVETYVELDEEGQREYEALVSEDENREVQAMEMTWAEKLEARGVEKGIERGREEGQAVGVR